MNSQTLVSNTVDNQAAVPAELPPARTTRRFSAPVPHRFPSYASDEDTAYRQAELFYLQKQIQAQTHMVFVLADGERIEGVIEWYDRNALKVRGREKTLIYKSSLKYMYKFGENAQQ